MTNMLRRGRLGLEVLQLHIALMRCCVTSQCRDVPRRLGDTKNENSREREVNTVPLYTRKVGIEPLQLLAYAARDFLQAQFVQRIPRSVKKEPSGNC